MKYILTIYCIFYYLYINIYHYLFLASASIDLTIFSISHIKFCTISFVIILTCASVWALSDWCAIIFLLPNNSFRRLLNLFFVFSVPPRSDLGKCEIWTGRAGRDTGVGWNDTIKKQKRPDSTRLFGRWGWQYGQTENDYFRKPG